MESFLEQSVQKYLEIVGKDVVLKKVPTPSLPEEAKEHPARAPCGVGPVSQCTWCGTIHPVTEPTKSKSTPTPTGISAQKPGDEIVKGELAPHAASVLMKLLYAARIARFDLLRRSLYLYKRGFYFYKRVIEKLCLFNNTCQRPCSLHHCFLKVCVSWKASSQRTCSVIALFLGSLCPWEKHPL